MKGGRRNQHWLPNERLWRETNEGRQGGSRTQQQARMEIMQGDKWRETRRQRQARAGQNGDHAGRQMKAGAAKSRPEWRSRRETNEGRQMKAGAGQNGDHEGRQMKGDNWRQERPRAGQNGDHEGRNEGRQMKAGAAKSRPEWIFGQ